MPFLDRTIASDTMHAHEPEPMQIDAPSAAALSTPQTNEIQHHHHHHHHLSRDDQQAKTRSDQARQHRIRVKNRRKRYLDTHPEYFNSGLELADPLLYDRLVRRFQTPAEREAEGRAKGYSGVLEADLLRSEAKLAALHNPDGSSVVVRRGSNGEIQLLEDEGDELATMTKEEGLARWRDDMTQRFLRGEDRDFRYEEVDESDEWDDVAEEERTAQDRYFDDEDPAWVHSGPGTPAITGETGVQDF